MLTAIGAVLGFMGSLFPELLKLYKDRQDKKHELAMIDKQLEATKAGITGHLEEVGIQADVQDMQNVYQSAKLERSGIAWVDALLEIINALVRPTITYLYFWLYLTVKYANYAIMKAQLSLDWKAAILANWTDFDGSMLAAIIGFWFGNRMVSGYLKKANIVSVK